jgi:hypothetical protein
MRPTYPLQAQAGTNHFVRADLNSFEAIRQAVIRSKESVLNEYISEAGEHARVLRLALNEAEAISWQSDYPHLLFPALATEKAQAAVSWHRQQRAIRRTPNERAFAE